MGERRLFALVRGHRMKRLLKRMLDSEEFLSDHGIRALSRYHRDHPYVLTTNGATYTVAYEPAAGPCLAHTTCVKPTRTGATTSCSTSTSTATRGPASARVTRPGGQR